MNFIPGPDESFLIPSPDIQYIYRIMRKLSETLTELYLKNSVAFLGHYGLVLPL